MAQEIAARNSGGGDPFADPRMQTMAREINLLRAGSDAAQLAAGVIRKARLDLLQSEADRLENRARKRDKEARVAVALLDPANGTSYSAELNHAALVALHKSNKAEYRVNQAQSDVLRAESEGETWRAIGGAANLAADLGVGEAGGIGGGGYGGGIGTAALAGAAGVGLGLLAAPQANRGGRRRRRY